MHPIIYNVARQRYLSSTISSIEKRHLSDSKLHYNMQPWYKRLNGFSNQACLHLFRNASVNKETLSIDVLDPQSLLFRYNMGIDISSVFISDIESSSQPSSDFYQPSVLNKFHYLQAHLSRVIQSIAKEIKVSKDDNTGRYAKINALDNLEYIIDNQPIELLETNTQVVALQTISNLYSKVYHRHTECIRILEKALSLQQGSQNPDQLNIAKTISQLAELYNITHDTGKAKHLLLEAAEIYEKDRRKCGEYKQPFDFGVLLGLLGVIYGTLGMKQESKDTIERSLMLLQAQPPDTNDEAATKKFGGDFASALTDLGHSYVSLGLPLYGKKILDLALAAHKNIHGENHSEVVRTFTILGISHLMQGHNEESKKLRSEAGKIQQSINALPIY